MGISFPRPDAIWAMWDEWCDSSLAQRISTVAIAILLAIVIFVYIPYRVPKGDSYVVEYGWAWEPVKYRTAKNQELADGFEAEVRARPNQWRRLGDVDAVVRNSFVERAHRDSSRSFRDIALLIGLGFVLHFALRRRATGPSVEEIAAEYKRRT